VRGGITTFTPEGESSFMPHSDFYVTNICFGGTHRSTAFITYSMSGQLVSTPWSEPGHPLNFVTY
jgi:gluconolactonase